MFSQGFIKFIILLIIAVIVLGYFGISLRTVFKEGGATRDNLEYAWQIVRTVWENYLRAPAYYCWNVFYNLLWRSFVENAERIREGKPPVLLEGQPTVETSAPSQ